MNGKEIHTTCIVPIKSLDQAKSRLAPLLPEESRVRIVLAMLDHTLSVLCSVAAVRRVLVVSPDRRVGEAAASAGADFYAEPDAPGLNGSLERARRAACLGGTDALLVLPGDLPLLTRQDVELLIQPDEKKTVLRLAADCADKGTNGLFAAPLFDFPFCFGEESLAMHILTGRRAGAQVTILRSPGLGLDVDTPQDYLGVAELFETGGQSRLCYNVAK